MLSCCIVGVCAGQLGVTTAALEMAVAVGISDSGLVKSCSNGLQQNTFFFSSLKQLDTSDFTRRYV